MSGRGHVRPRAGGSFELKYEGGPPDVAGRRKTVYETVRARTKKEAEQILTQRLAALDAGVAIEPSKQTIAQHLTDWLDHAADLAPKTLERYRQLAERQIIPRLGAVRLQKLKPLDVADWHRELLQGGSAHGKPLAPRTVGHAHRVLHRAYQRAIGLELVSRNPLAAVPPPAVEEREMTILSAAQIAEFYQRFGAANNPTKRLLYPLAAAALNTGMRRGELLGSRWGDIDFGRGAWAIARSLEQTAAGLRFKPPKTTHGRRTIRIGPNTLALLRRHRAEQIEQRLRLGRGAPAAADPVFADAIGELLAPDTLSRDWANAIRDFPSLPPIPFHALRHTFASVKIADGWNPVLLSRHLGHGSPAITMKVYAHLFAQTDDTAADTLDALLPAPAAGSTEYY